MVLDGKSRPSMIATWQEKPFGGLPNAERKMTRSVANLLLNAARVALTQKKTCRWEDEINVYLYFLYPIQHCGSSPETCQILIQLSD